MTTKIPPLDQYWEELAGGLPTFSPEEQRAAVALYRELAKGQPVDAAQLGRALGASPWEGRALLSRGRLLENHMETCVAECVRAGEGEKALR